MSNKPQNRINTVTPHRWCKTPRGDYKHQSGASIGKRINNNPHRMGDWFLINSPKGWQGCIVPANGVKTLREAKRLVEQEYDRIAQEAK